MEDITISKRTRNGRDFWEVNIPAGFFANDPKRKSKSFDREREAKAYRNQLLGQKETGAVVSPNRMTVADLMHEWLETVARHNVKPKVFVDYESLIRVHVIPGVGSIAVKALHASQLQAFYSAKLKAGASTNIVDKCHKRIKQALEHAVNMGYVPVNVAGRVKPPRVEKKVMKTWTRDQGRAFLDAAAGSAYGPIWLVQLGTGMRIGEALGLRWRDVDLDNGTVRVVQAVSLVKGIPTIQTPKTPRSRRPVGITPRVVAALRAHRVKQNERRLHLGDRWEDHDLVFPANNGRPANANNITRNYNIMIAKVRIPRIRIHDLRHTHATWLREEGVDLKAVQDRLGHSRSSVTIDFYGHITPRMDAHTLEAVDRALGDV